MVFACTRIASLNLASSSSLNFLLATLPLASTPCLGQSCSLKKSRCPTNQTMTLRGCHTHHVHW